VTANPELVCQCCDRVIARTEPVRWGAFYDREPWGPAGFGLMRDGTLQYVAPVCPECWAIPVDDRKSPDGMTCFRLAGRGPEMHPQPCAWCGRPVILTRERRWVVCSDLCRVAARRDRERRDRIDNPDLCDGCRASMPGCRRGRRFCSDACRQRDYRIRAAERAAKREADWRLFAEYGAALGWHSSVPAAEPS